MKTQTVLYVLSVMVVIGIAFFTAPTAYAAGNPTGQFPLVANSPESAVHYIMIARHMGSAGTTNSGISSNSGSSITSHIQSGTSPTGGPCGGPGQSRCQNVPVGRGYNCVHKANHITCVPLKPE
jgi:hypothetical protein